MTCEEWEAVADEHNQSSSHRRTGDSLKSKFQALYRMRPGTGEPNIPEEVKLAKQIRRLIVRDNDTSMALPDDEEDLDDDDGIRQVDEYHRLLEQQEEHPLPMNPIAEHQVLEELPPQVNRPQEQEAHHRLEEDPRPLVPSTNPLSSASKRFKNNLPPKASKPSTFDTINTYLSRADLLREQDRVHREEKEQERREERLRLEEERREERLRIEEERREDRRRWEEERREERRRREEDLKEERLCREDENRRWEMMFAAMIPVVASFKRDDNKKGDSKE